MKQSATIILFISLCFAQNIEAQAYEKTISDINENSEVESQIQQIDSVLAASYWQQYPDSLAMWHLYKSQVLFRNTISIEESIAALDEGLALIDAVEHRNLWLELWYYKGYWYRKWDKYELAKEALNNVLSYKENNPLSWAATIQLGKTYKDRGDFTLALELYDQALILAENNPQRKSVTYEVISFVYLIMDTEAGAKAAIPWLDKLISHLKTMPDEGHYIASATYNKGCAYMTLEDYENASLSFDESEYILNACCETDLDFKSLLLESRGELHMVNEEYEKALSSYRKSINLYQHSFDLTRSDGLSSTYRSIAEILLKLDRKSESLRNINKAISLRLGGINADQDVEAKLDLAALSRNGEKHYLIDELLFKGALLTDIYTDHGKIEDANSALSTLIFADELVDMMRLEIIEQKSKSFWREKTTEVYQQLVSLSFMLQDYEMAFHYSEKSKFLLMGEHLNAKNTRFASINSQVSKEEIGNYATLNHQILRIENKVKDPSNTIDREALQKEYIEIRNQQDDLLSQIKQNSPHFYEENFTFKITNIDILQADLIESSQSYVEYFLTDSFIYIFVLDPKELSCVKRELPAGFRDDITELRAITTSEQRNHPDYLHRFRRLSYSIFETCLAPVYDRLRKNIVIIPDDILSLVPFSTLLTKNVEHQSTISTLREWPFLLKEKHVSYIKSTSLAYAQSKTHKEKANDKRLIALSPSWNEEWDQSDIASHTIRNQLSPLYGTQQEIDYLKENTKGFFLESTDATETAIDQQLSHNVSILHIASHALIDNVAPEYSKLILQTDKENDGFLHSYEIANMDIDADLVILSACNTAYGPIEKGEGINSLGNAFARAGSPNLLLSLWPVSDHATSSLIKEYYQQLFSGTNKRSALGKAQISFMDNVPAAFHHPYYWGGFIYYGDDAMISFDDAKSSSLGLSNIPLMLLIISLLGFIYYLFTRKDKSDIDQLVVS